MLVIFKDDMRVSFMSELYTSCILTILSSETETYCRKYEKLPNIVIHADITEK